MENERIRSRFRNSTDSTPAQRNRQPAHAPGRDRPNAMRRMVGTFDDGSQLNRPAYVPVADYVARRLAAFWSARQPYPFATHLVETKHRPSFRTARTV